MTDDWADKLTKELWYGSEVRVSYFEAFAQALRQARAEGMRMAAAMAEQRAKIWQHHPSEYCIVINVAKEIRAAAEKEEQP